jgi:hypothetical protein
MCVYAAVFALPTLLYEAPKKAVAVRAKRWLKISCLMKFVLKFAFESMVICAKKVVLHLGTAYHTVFISLLFLF